MRGLFNTTLLRRTLLEAESISEQGGGVTKPPGLVASGTHTRGSQNLKGRSAFLKVLRDRPLHRDFKDHMFERAHLSITKAVLSLYEERHRPLQRDVQKRLREQQVEEPIVQSLMGLCARWDGIFHIEPPSAHWPPVIYLLQEPPDFAGWVEEHSGDDTFSGKQRFRALPPVLQDVLDPIGCDSLACKDGIPKHVVDAMQHVVHCEASQLAMAALSRLMSEHPQGARVADLSRFSKEHFASSNIGSADIWKVLDYIDVTAVGQPVQAAKALPPGKAGQGSQKGAKKSAPQALKKIKDYQALAPGPLPQHLQMFRMWSQ